MVRRRRTLTRVGNGFKRLSTTHRNGFGRELGLGQGLPPGCFHVVSQGSDDRDRIGVHQIIHRKLDELCITP